MARLNSVKNVTMQVTYFLKDPVFNLLFYCHIILYWEKMTSYEKCSLEVPIVWKISRFNAIDGSIQMLKIVEFPKISLKWKIWKRFTSSKQRAALRNLFGLPLTYFPPDKVLLPLWNKHFLTEIYRNLQTSVFKVL